MDETRFSKTQERIAGLFVEGYRRYGPFSLFRSRFGNCNSLHIKKVRRLRDETRELDLDFKHLKK